MKAISILARVLAIAGAGAAAYFWIDIGDQLEEARQDIDRARSDLNRTQANLREAEEEREAFEQLAEQREAELEEALSENEILVARAADLEADMEQVIADLQERENDLAEIRADNRDLRNQLLDLRGEEGEDALVASLQSEVDRLERELEEAWTRLEEWEERPDTATEERTHELATVRGDVISVGPDSSFIVVDIGANRDIRTGNEFLVFRGDRFIARARVSSVQEEQSIAQVVSGPAGFSINRGDRVRLTRPGTAVN